MLGIDYASSDDEDAIPATKAYVRRGDMLEEYR
jgi:hypothetical protein